MEAGDWILIDDVVDFLASVGASHLCPICQTDKWHLHMMLLGGDGLLYFGKPQKDLVEVNNGRYRLTCQNCGYSREHDVSLVRQWKRGGK